MKSPCQSAGAVAIKDRGNELPECTGSLVTGKEQVECEDVPLEKCAEYFVTSFGSRVVLPVSFHVWCDDTFFSSGSC